MENNFKELLIDRLAEKNFASRDELEGCSEPEIAALMADQEVKRLPEVYRQFLLLLGRNAGKLWSRSVFTFPDILGLKNDAIELLAGDNNPITLPSDAFVFFMEEGLIFFYFLTNNNDDNPPVYLYLQVEYVHKEIVSELTSFLLKVY